MPDSNTIALVSVIGATSTAMAVPLINGAFAARADRRRFEHERDEKDRDERRVLLDECAHALADYIDATRGLMGRYLFSPRREEAAQLEYYRADLSANVDAKQRAYALDRRLVIRMGRGSAVVKAYGAMLAMLDEASVDVAARITERTSDKPDRRADLLAGQQQLDRAWDEAHERFLDAATSLVGSP